ncbi:MAG: peptidylprolyl isomerase [Chlorobi bacterium]|nr:peptidylprolyl isomerase [Chlorobiota bacterium]
MNPTGYIVGLVGLVFLAGSCSQKPQQAKRQEHAKVSREESLIKANRYLVKSENEEIDNYVARHGWKMEKTPSGLRYMIYQKGSGPLAKKGEVAVLNYKLMLITGDVLYSSDSTGPLVFEIGHGDVESGLEEALLLLRKGDKARVIIPSHLGHGLLGDQKKIPPRSTVIYDLEVINLK